jgi:hypothetical protein
MNGESMFHLFRVVMSQEDSDISPEMRRKLQTLTLQDMDLLAGCRCRIFSISLHEDELNRALRRVDLVKKDRQLIHEYIRHGASTAMMKSIFGMNREDTTRLRGELGVPNQGGRPCKPLPYESSRIWDMWRSCRQMEERERFLHIAKRMEMPLPVIWNEIKSRTLGENRHGNGDAGRKTSPRDAD